MSDERTFQNQRDKELIFLREKVAALEKQLISQELLNETLQRTQFAIDHAREAIFLVARDARLVYVNNSACSSLEYTREELLSMTVFDIDPALPRALWDDLWNRGQDGSSYSFETKHQTKSGRVFAVEITSSPFAFYGDEYRFSYVRDITDRKRAEAERLKLEQQLIQAQKMEAIGTLAGGIAHDFNNLLTVILGHACLLLAEIPENHPHYLRLKSIETQALSAAYLIKQLLGFARGGKYEVVQTDLNKLIQSMSEMFGRTRKDITITCRLHPELSLVEIDRVQIEQVFVNLLLNASQAMPGGGTIFLSTENVSFDAHSGDYGLPPGTYVKSTVSDTGVGMDETTLKHIFEPFFTTKDKGIGTGLGLASAYGIIKNHGGIIHASSEIGHGSTFIIYLPASGKQALDEPAVLPEIVAGTGTILLVDDQDAVVEIGTEMLESLGYNVLAARSGQEAIKIYSERGNQIQLVILDLIMPGMSGSETFDRLKQIDPNIRIVLSSGYSINGQAAEIIRKGCLGFIGKPFNLQDLSGKIHTILAT